MGRAIDLEFDVAGDRGQATPSVFSLPPWLDATVLLNRLSLGWYVMNAGWEKVGRELAGGPGTFHESDSFQGRSAILPEFLAVRLYLALAGVDLRIALDHRVVRARDAAVTAWLLLSIGIALFFPVTSFSRATSWRSSRSALLLCLLGPGRHSADRLIGRSGFLRPA
jgi:uncharacterized membrane protein YphA (DoxX/SURF4 family)